MALADQSPLPEIPHEDLEYGDPIGSGGYGNVYRARWISKDKIVAVKKVLVLDYEAHILKLLSHRNIIQFFGAVTISPNYCIITEYAENGSLSDVLQKDVTQTLDFDKILRWALDVANGVKYLHHDLPITVLHRDLKSKNVVMTKDWVCKLCDFGTSRCVAATQQFSQAGTYPWMSPEVIRSEPVSTPADTYSFGVILWELLTRETPFDGLNWFRIAYMVAEQGERLKVPDSCPQDFKLLIESCWHGDPKSRPSFINIVRRLESMEKDDELSNETAEFLAKKQAWLQEIEAQCAILKQRQKDVSDKELELRLKEKQLDQKAADIATQKRAMLSRAPSYDVNSWDSDDVANWLRNKFSDLEHDFLEHLIMTFSVNQINGARLLLIVEKDLVSFGVQSSVIRRQLMAEIDLLKLNNQRLQNFPPLDHANKQLEDNIMKKSAPWVKLRFTLIFGAYCRRRRETGGDADLAGSSSQRHASSENHSTNSGSIRWKLFVDVDDLECADAPADFDPHDCIKSVTFLSKIPAYEVFKISEPPYVAPEWQHACLDNLPSMDCLPESKELFSCIISYSDAVKQPRNTKYAYTVRSARAAISGVGSYMEEQSVLLTVRPKLSHSGSRRLMSSPATQMLSPLSSGGHKTSLPATTVGLNMSHSQSTPILQGAWGKIRSYPDAVSNYPATLLGSPDKGKNPMWAEIATGLRTVADPSTSRNPARYTRKLSSKAAAFGVGDKKLNLPPVNFDIGNSDTASERSGSICEENEEDANAEANEEALTPTILNGQSKTTDGSSGFVGSSSPGRNPFRFDYAAVTSLQNGRQEPPSRQVSATSSSNRSSEPLTGSSSNSGESSSISNRYRNPNNRKHSTKPNHYNSPKSASSVAAVSHFARNQRSKSEQWPSLAESIAEGVDISQIPVDQLETFSDAPVYVPLVVSPQPLSDVKTNVAQSPSSSHSASRDHIRRKRYGGSRSHGKLQTGSSPQAFTNRTTKRPSLPTEHMMEVVSAGVSAFVPHHNAFLCSSPPSSSARNRQGNSYSRSAYDSLSQRSSPKGLSVVPERSKKYVSSSSSKANIRSRPSGNEFLTNGDAAGFYGRTSSFTKPSPSRSDTSQIHPLIQPESLQVDVNCNNVPTFANDLAEEAVNANGVDGEDDIINGTRSTVSASVHGGYGKWRWKKD